MRRLASLLLHDAAVNVVQKRFLLSIIDSVDNNIGIFDTAINSFAFTVFSFEADHAADTIDATIFGVVLVPRPSGPPAIAAHLLLFLLLLLLLNWWRRT